MILLLIHVLHVAATCISLGGLFYARMVLLPNMAVLPESERDDYLKHMMRRFGMFKWSGIAILAVTGVVQWIIIFPTVSDKGHYLMAFSLKMLGAIGLLTITALLALPDPRLEKMQAHRAFWAGLNLVCGLMILTGAALMRTFH